MAVGQRTAGVRKLFKSKQIQQILYYSIEIDSVMYDLKYRQYL